MACKGVIVIHTEEGMHTRVISPYANCVGDKCGYFRKCWKEKERGNEYGYMYDNGRNK